MKPDFFGSFAKNTETSNFIKIFPVGADFLHTDRAVTPDGLFRCKQINNITYVIVDSIVISIYSVE